MASTLTSLHRGRFAILSIALPGRRREPAGVVLWDQTSGEAATRFRRDFHLISDEEDLEVMIALERDLDVKLREMGPEVFLTWAEDTLSNTITMSNAESVSIDSFDTTLTRLYRKHVPAAVQRYETHLPRIRLAAAAGSWGNSMNPESFADNAEEWIEVPEDLRIDEQMFVAQVTGRSMEPKIPDGSLCVFRYQPAGSRRGRCWRPSYGWWSRPDSLSI